MFKLFNNTIVLNCACVCVLQSDNGGEYVGNKFSDYLRNISIQFEPAPAYTLPYNGVAERFNQTIGKMAHTMILRSTLPKSFWAEAVTHAINTNNCLPTRANKDRSPFKMLHGHPPQLSHLHPFGAHCFLFLHEDHQDKLSAKSHKVVYLGTQGISDVYQLWVPASHTSTTSHNIIFAPLDDPVHAETSDNNDDDHDTPAATIMRPLPPVPPHPDNANELHLPGLDDTLDLSAPPSPIISFFNRFFDNDDNKGATIQSSSSSSKPPAPIPIRFAKHTHRPAPPQRAPEPPPPPPPRQSHQENKGRPAERYKESLLAQQVDVMTPNSYREAVSSPHASQWQQAMHKEHNALLHNSTYTLVLLPADCKAVGTRWIFKIKHCADSSIKQYKARWVAKGYTQWQGIDYNEMFAPVVQLENLHLLLVLATLLNLEVDQIDINSAFLQADINEQVYISQLEGFESTQHPDYVCLLQKSLYGLKQAPLLWNWTFNMHMCTIGFTLLEADLCIYILKTVHDQLLTIVSVYVDNCLIISLHMNVDRIK
jgi:hypothetical protein